MHDRVYPHLHLREVARRYADYEAEHGIEKTLDDFERPANDAHDVRHDRCYDAENFAERLNDNRKHLGDNWHHFVHDEIDDLLDVRHGRIDCV